VLRQPVAVGVQLGGKVGVAVVIGQWATHGGLRELATCENMEQSNTEVEGAISGQLNQSFQAFAQDACRRRIRK
jgi:hypothetical protein